MSGNRTSKVLGFSLPPTVVKEVEKLAKQERRTKSELFREMVRVYQNYRLQRDRDELRWIDGIIDEARREQKTAAMTSAAVVAEDRRLSRYGQEQAEKIGLKTDSKSINRIVHERRKRHRP